MRISQLAERSGVPATTLRFYESRGLLPADRSAAGYRVYDEDSVRRLAFIDAAKHLGLPLGEIAELLAVWQSGLCAQVKADLRPRVAKRLAEVARRVDELARLSSVLHGALDHLDVLPDREDPCGPECALPGPGSAPIGSSTVADMPLFADREAAEADAERWRSAPVVCTLSGSDARERVAHWRNVLDGATRAAIPDGLRLTVPSDRAAVVAALAAEEQRCCAFFDFRMYFDGPCLHLEVRVPAAGAALLEGLFAEAGPSQRHNHEP